MPNTPETRLETHLRHLEQARRAFAQNPTPSLGSAIKRLENAVRYERQCMRQAAFERTSMANAIHLD